MDNVRHATRGSVPGEIITMSSGWFVNNNLFDTLILLDLHAFTCAHMCKEANNTYNGVIKISLDVSAHFMFNEYFLNLFL
jgi:hypothetical protein